jgi:peptidoglycan-associated lipoprotein
MKLHRFSMSIIFILVVSMILIPGCAKKQTTSQPLTTQPAQQAPATSRQGGGAGGGTIQPLTPQQPREQAPGQISFLPVYFDLDQSSIRQDQLTVLSRNAQLLEKYTTITIRLEGNCDERDTEEYNISLGQRRADSVKDYFTNYGISASRMTTVSYGEMRPVAAGHDEAAWSQNRRVEIVVVPR